MDLKELKTTAQLAMLDIPNPEELGEAFSQMLEYFSVMAEVDVDGLEPTTHALAKENRLRPDTVNTGANPDALLDRAPDRSDRFFRMFRYYLLSSAGAFRSRSIQLWQIVMTRPGSDQPECRIS